MLAQFIAVTRNKQEGIVGSRTKDQDRQDAAGGVVKDEAKMWQQLCGQGCGHLTGAPNNNEGHQPQQCAAVRQHEQQGHHDDRGEQQLHVRAVKDVAEVALHTHRTGEENAKPAVHETFVGVMLNTGGEIAHVRRVGVIDHGQDDERRRAAHLSEATSTGSHE